MLGAVKTEPGRGMEAPRPHPGCRELAPRRSLQGLQRMEGLWWGCRRRGGHAGRLFPYRLETGFQNVGRPWREPGGHGGRGGWVAQAPG